MTKGADDGCTGADRMPPRLTIQSWRSLALLGAGRRITRPVNATPPHTGGLSSVLPSCWPRAL